MSKKKTDNKVVNETEAAETLHAGSRPANEPKTKLDALNSIMSMMHATPSDEWMGMVNSWKAEWESNKSKMPNNASKNADTIKTTLEQIAIETVKEDTEALFTDTDITDEGKEKITVLFEAAVNARVNARMLELAQEYETKFEEEIEAITEDLMVKIDTYLTVVTEDWMEQNKVAIKSTVKAEAVENLVAGLKTLFAENNIDLPEADAEAFNAVNAKVKELEEKLDATMTEMVALKKEKMVAEAADLIDEAAEGLALTQKEKFQTLAEGVEFKGDKDSYLKKLKIVRDTHFKEDKKQAQSIDETIVALGDVLTEQETGGKKNTSDDPMISNILGVLDRDRDSRRVISQ